MAHTFFCEFCGKRFDVDEALIGKRARCKDCKHEFVIPGHTSPSAPFDPYRRDEPTPWPADKNPYALRMRRSIPRGWASRSTSRWQGRGGAGRRAMRFTSGPGSLTLCGRGRRGRLPGDAARRPGGEERITWPDRRRRHGTYQHPLGPDQPHPLHRDPVPESIVAGLLYLFVPFYNIYYLITRWYAMKRPFIMGFTGGFLLGLSGQSSFSRSQPVIVASFRKPSDMH